MLKVVEDPATYSSKVSRFLQVPNNLDGAEHERFREILDPYFSEHRMAELEPQVRSVARRLVGELPRGESVK